MTRSTLAGGARSSTSTKKPASLALTFCPTVTLISVVRRFVEGFYSVVLDHRDTANRLALVTHELVENAAKYSMDGEAVLFIVCDTASGVISVRTSNRATPDRIGRLRQVFAEMSAAVNAASLYMEAMRRSAVTEPGSGGLGLARIWAVCDMVLTLAVEGDGVEISAQGRVTSG